MNKKLFDKYRRTSEERFAWTNPNFDMVIEPYGKYLTYCSCGTIDCRNSQYKFHKWFRMWSPKKKVGITEYLRNIFPLYGMSHVYRSIEIPNPNFVKKVFHEWYHESGRRYELYDAFVSEEYQTLLLTKWPAKHRDIWQQPMGISEYMKATIAFMDLHFDKDKPLYKKRVAKFVAQRMKGKT